MNDDDVFLFDKSWTNDSWTKFNASSRSHIIKRPNNFTKYKDRQVPTVADTFDSGFKNTLNHKESALISSSIRSPRKNKEISFNLNSTPPSSDEREQVIKDKITKDTPSHKDGTDREIKNTEPKTIDYKLRSLPESIRTAESNENVRASSVSPKIFRSKPDLTEASSSSAGVSNCRDVMYASVQSLNRWRTGTDAPVDKEDSVVMGFSQNLWKKVESKATGFFSSIARKN